jgi:hypothetical protein
MALRYIHRPGFLYEVRINMLLGVKKVKRSHQSTKAAFGSKTSMENFQKTIFKLRIKILLKLLLHKPV